MDASDIPDRLIPPHWSPAQVVCAGFAAGSTASGPLVAVLTGRPAALGLTVVGVLAFALLPARGVIGPFLVVAGTILLQFSLLSRQDTAGARYFAVSVTCAYGVFGPVAVALGCCYCRIWSSRFRQVFFGDRHPEDT